MSWTGSEYQRKEQGGVARKIPGLNSDLGNTTYAIPVGTHIEYRLADETTWKQYVTSKPIEVSSRKVESGYAECVFQGWHIKVPEVSMRTIDKNKQSKYDRRRQWMRGGK